MTNQNGRRRGLFIVFEGIDGSGKSSMMKEVAKLFKEKGKKVWMTGEPTSSRIGKLARASLKKKTNRRVMALLMAADRLAHTDDIIESLADPNKVILCDRYKYSALAYQTLSLAQETVETLNEGTVEPDIVLLFDVMPEIAVNRIGVRGSTTDVFETLETLKAVRQNYLDMHIENGIKINANLTPEDVLEEIKLKLTKEGVL